MEQRLARIGRLIAAAALGMGTAGAASVTGAVNAVPPAEYRPATVAQKSVATLAVVSTPALRIDLPEPATEFRAQRAGGAAAAARADAASPSKQRPLVIGFPREVPESSRAVALAGLAWHESADGARTARVEVRSPGAAGLRLALSVQGAGFALRFAGSAPGATVHGPYPADEIAGAVARDGAFATPVLEGDTAIVEVSAPAGASIADGALVLGTASRLTAAGVALRDAMAKRLSDIGMSGTCNADVACVSPSTALQQAANSLGKIVFGDRNGFTYACSAALLNDSVNSFVPYLLTSAHCIESAFEAGTISVYWFFRAQSCGSTATPAYVLQGGGAALLARSDDWDYALLRLNRAPPAGVFFSAWRAEPVPALAVATGLHHPNGDLAKFSQGSTTGYQSYSDGSSFVRVQWSQGTTEVGSSGSGLYTFLPEGGYYELRGALFGGEASCSNRSGPDYYSRLDVMLPLVRQYLTPDAPNPEGRRAVVEYYHAGLRHYFITADPGEVEALDSGAIAGWERTGVRFLAYDAPRPGASPVCRYYLTPAVGNSHFYSADPAECARVGERYAGTWIHESPAVFHIALPHPVSGACPAGTRALWRFFNPGLLNHRYTPEVTLRNEMRADPAWIGEGYGPDSVIMCAPTDPIT
ncbi:MAG: serine protease [Betaproteobacteria bacterium]|nr:serine protease [Betaproteobacteria bacterium]